MHLGSMAVVLLALGALSCGRPLPTAAAAPADAPEARVAEGMSAEPAAPEAAEPEASGLAAEASGPERGAALRATTGWKADPGVPLDERPARALERRSGVVRELFAQAGASFPPAELYFRAFKREGELEVWAASESGGRMVRVATYEICALSGDLGPKRAEGDQQVPEGFYVVQYTWPSQRYLLEMNISYPNAADRALARGAPGGAIMIHGACGSIGCLAMGDERAEELWTMVAAAQGPERRVHVHIFPTRAWDQVLADERYARHRAFWRNLREGYDAFEKTRHRPAIRVDWQARYLVAPGGEGLASLTPQPPLQLRAEGEEKAEIAAIRSEPSAQAPPLHGAGEGAGG